MTDAGLEPPTSLRDGRYVVLQPLGEGAQGTTWDAVDKREGRAVAIKRFDLRAARTWKDVELAEREARVLASLAHPKLPRYLDHFEQDGAFYLVMEKIEGVPLSTLRKQGRMPQDEVVRFLRDADTVLGYLQARAPPVVHRDLKPANVIRRPDGSFAFVDFGAVRDTVRPEGGSTVVGTFGYMAPEQFQGRAGPGTDVYAIGATALALLTGQEPESLPHKGLAIDVDAALAGRAGRPLRQALARMLEPDPDKRPTRIAPLLKDAFGPEVRHERVSDSEWVRLVERGSKMGRQIRAKVEREIRDEIERASRHARHHTGRDAKRARKLAERQWRHGNARARGPQQMPWFMWIVVALSLTVAQLAVLLALRVAVPIVLGLLSIVLGRPLRDAARRVSDAGVRASAAIDRARDHVLRERDESAEQSRARVAPAYDEPRVRVPEAPADGLEEGREGEAETHAPRRTRPSRD